MGVTGLLSLQGGSKLRGLTLAPHSKFSSGLTAVRMQQFMQTCREAPAKGLPILDPYNFKPAELLALPVVQQ